MLIRTIPAALDLGTQLQTETNAERFKLRKGKVSAPVCWSLELNQALAVAEIAQTAIKIIAKIIYWLVVSSTPWPLCCAAGHLTLMANWK